MIGLELIIYSLRNIWKRKLRNFLTMFSIFIGITTIFIFISFGLGLYEYIEKTTSEGSADKVIIQSKGAGLAGLGDNFALTEDDLKSIEKSQGVYEATGIYIKPAELKQKRKIKYAFLIAYDPDKPLIMDVSNVNIKKGRNLKENDKGKVVLGYNYMIDDKIFPEKYDINDRINIQGRDLKIVGFLEKIGNPQDDSNIYINDNFLDDLYPDKENSYSWIIARVDTKKINDVISNIEDNLRKSRDVEEGKEDFFVQSFDDLIKSYSMVLNIMIGFLILIALISVVVSAINTSNSMITSVLERIKEIGVMKSIGAKNSDIFKIFLFESEFLGFIGGIIGILLGIIITSIGRRILDQLGWGFLQPSYSPYLFIGCILFAVFTGAISGVLPAINASRVNPVDALRYE